MKYNVEFIVCFTDNTWELSPSMEIEEDIMNQGEEEIIFHAMEHVLLPYCEDMSRPVCHFGVYYYSEADNEDDDWDETSTLTSYDIGNDNE